MRTLRLSLPILGLIVLPLLLLVTLGCRAGEDTQQPGNYYSDIPEEDPIKEGNPFQVAGPGEEIVGDLADLGELLGGGFAVIDPGRDVYDYGTGDDVADHPELDLTVLKLALGDDTQQAKLEFTFSEEPGKDEFVSGFVAFTEEEPSDRPLGDPFAPYSRYLYFWRMNADSYAAVLEQTDGVATVLDESIEFESDGPTVRLRVPVDAFAALSGLDAGWDSSTGSAYMIVVATDGFGNCDYLDESTLVAVPWP